MQPGQRISRSGVWKGLGVDVQAAAGRWPGQHVGRGLREGTHMGVSERGEEREEREHTLHKADCDT